MRSRKRSEVFGWSQIPKNTKGWISYPTPEVELNHFLHHTSTLGFPVEIVQFFKKHVLKQRILAVYCDFHWLLVATTFIITKFYSRYVKV